MSQFDASAPAAPFIASPLQEDIFEFVRTGVGSAAIEAVAGSGKTTTIVKCLELISPHQSVLFLAFNKSIAEELAKRVPRHVLAKTFHSVGFAAWQRHVGRNRLRVESGKVRALLQENLGQEDYSLYGYFVTKLVSLAKNMGVGYLVPDTEQTWMELISHHGLSLESLNAKVTRAVAIAQLVLADSINMAAHVIDYDDMLFMPLIKDVGFYQNDWVFVDEFQDTNQVQQALLKRMLKPQGRLIVVGDPHQAIYGFRGADSTAMAAGAQAFGCQHLPLTVSYRCPARVVAEAKKYVSHIESAPDAALGGVERPASYRADLFTPEEAILCRNAAPLVKLAYSLLRRHVPCRILGREIGQGLVTLIRSLRAETLADLSERLQIWEAREYQSFVMRGNDAAAEGVRDKAECIRFFMEALLGGEQTVEALTGRIEGMFTDNGAGRLTLCTVHKSKGLEWGTVNILDFDKYMPSKWAKKPWQKQQEANLQYVAITRTKGTLRYIDTEGLLA